jgi:Tfp pilus assembly protein PilZ
MYYRLIIFQLIACNGSVRMGTNSLFVAILSADEEEKKALAELMKSLNAEYFFAAAIRDLRDFLFEHPCNGILFCIASIIGIDQSGKSFIQMLEQIYPTARIRWNKEQNLFAIVATRGGRIQTPSDFLALCSSFAPRRLRKNERQAKTLNVLISCSPDLSNAVCTCSINISLRGCFLHTFQEWKVGDPIFVQIQEMPGKPVIEGTVIRYVPWGVPFRIQGIGIHFAGISKEQIKDLQQLLFSSPL